MLLSPGPAASPNCPHQLRPIRDALDVMSGKWKLLLTAIMRGNRHFGEIAAPVPGIRRPRAEEAGGPPARVLHRPHRRLPDRYYKYTTTDYVYSLRLLLLKLQPWRAGHRRRIMGG